MEDDDTMIAFKLPREHKRALMMVAADQGKGITASHLLREAVEAIIESYKDGVFLRIAVHDVEQNRSTDGTLHREKR